MEEKAPGLSSLIPNWVPNLLCGPDLSGPQSPHQEGTHISKGASNTVDILRLTLWKIQAQDVAINFLQNENISTRTFLCLVL
jgi:hypothetical protein